MAYLFHIHIHRISMTLDRHIELDSFILFEKCIFISKNLFYSKNAFFERTEVISYKVYMYINRNYTSKSKKSYQIQ